MGAPARSGRGFVHSLTGGGGGLALLKGTARPWPRQSRRQLQVKETFLTGLHGPLRSPSKHIDVVVHPGYDVAGHVRGAVGNVDNFLCTEDAVPYVELAELPHECLRGIESAPNGVLGRGEQNPISAGSKSGQVC